MDDHQIVALYKKRDEQAVMETECAYGEYCFTISIAMRLQVYMVERMR